MEPDLTTYDWIAISSSGGKDSQAMLSHLVEQCDALGISRDKIIVLHADLGRMEWLGTKDLVKRQTKNYSLRFEAISRPQGDLLHEVEHERHKWPSATIRYCTSHHKSAQISKIFTRLVNETRAKEDTKRQIRILDCWGIRAEESRARAKKDPFTFNKSISNGKRHVDSYMPIFTWLETDVWNKIKETGVPHHYAYDLGMPRLSCCFCIMSNYDALLIAGEHNPELLAEYVAVESRIKHDFRHKNPISKIQDDLKAGKRGNPHHIPVQLDCCA